MGAYTKQDVLDALADPILSRISIVCEGLIVSSFTLNFVKARISSDDIKVVEGTSEDNAYYNSGSDTLTTHKGPTPMPYWKKSVLIHECTHALMDVLEYETTTLTNELICYITQVAFEIMSDPRYKYSLNTSLPAGSDDAGWNKFWVNIEKYVRGLGFSSAFGGGVVMVKNDWQFQSLRNQINTLNIYQHLSNTTKSNNNGV